MWRIAGALNMLPLLVGAGFAGWALSRSGGVSISRGGTVMARESGGGDATGEDQAAAAE